METIEMTSEVLYNELIESKKKFPKVEINYNLEKQQGNITFKDMNNEIMVEYLVPFSVYQDFRKALYLQKK